MRVAFHDFKEVTPRQCSLNHISPATRFVMTKSDRSGVSVTSGPQQQQQWLYGIMGTTMPNKLPYLRPCLDGKYTTYDHSRTANTIPTWWLVSWDLMRPIGGDVSQLSIVEGLIFCTSATPHLGTFPLFHGQWTSQCSAIVFNFMANILFIHPSMLQK